MSDTPRTSEEWRRIQRLPDGRYSSQVTDEDLAHGMCNFAKQLERELAGATKQRDEWFEVFAKNLKKKGVLSDQLIEMRKQRDTLAEAAQAVVDRWDAPTWKDLEPTAKFMNALRKAIAAAKGGEA